MKQFIGAAAALLFTAAQAQGTCDNAVNDGGNWYCSSVKAIQYNGVGGDSSYNRITNMDADTGSCSSSPQGFSGNMSPLDEEVSLHFRGPLKLKQFAAYTPGSSGSSNNKARRSATARRHAHVHAHAHKREAKVGDIVTATINGEVVTWANEYDGGNHGATAAPQAAEATPAANLRNKVVDNGNSASSSSESSSDSSSDSDDSSYGGLLSGLTGSSGGDWSRTAYYNAGSGDADGVSFLSHNGGSGSGVFDYSFGNSLSYARSDGKGGCPSPEVLDDIEIGSRDEIIIMTDKECSGDSCGYTRPGSVAHHGFAGSEKAFFFEFQMPDDGQTGASKYDPVNMPAIWMLNAQIPRTLQYGNADCSCWTSGCGEFDIFECLAPGDKRLKSTLHGDVNGGSSDYFDRPVDKTIKAAMVMADNNIYIKVLDDDTTFGSSMSKSDIDDIVGSKSLAQQLISVFNLSS